MINTRILFLIVFFFMLYIQNSYGQKYEKESRLNYKDVPSTALNFIDALKINSKIRWYSEVGFKTKSIEAKFKRDDKRHSVEFDTVGNIQDVEIEMKWQKIRSEIKDSINFQLSSICLSYRISKIQIQYSGNQSKLLSFLKGKITVENVITNYEIIANCSVNGKIEQFEYLFNDKGILLNTFKIIFKNASNLEY